MKNKLKILIAVHKPYDVLRDDFYLPVHAGAAGRADLGYQSDAQGESISEKNGLYCELTALYWAWKNLDADAVGLVHYRRYFGVTRRCLPWIEPKTRIASGEELLRLLEKTPVLLPVKRNYFIETRENQYVRAHGRAGLSVLREVLGRCAPEYLPAFERSMRRTAGHCFNMFVMRRDLCDAYCAWMFSILFEVERVMRETMPEQITPRLFGFISERMIDCWIETHGFATRELPVVSIEKTDWPKKIAAFLKRKFARNERN